MSGEEGKDQKSQCTYRGFRKRAMVMLPVRVVCAESCGSEGEEGVGGGGGCGRVFEKKGKA